MFWQAVFQIINLIGEIKPYPAMNLEHMSQEELEDIATRGSSRGDAASRKDWHKIRFNN